VRWYPRPERFVKVNVDDSSFENICKAGLEMTRELG